MLEYFPALAARRAAGAVLLSGMLAAPGLAQTPAAPQPAPSAPATDDLSRPGVSGVETGRPGDPLAMPQPGATPGTVPPAGAPALDRKFATDAGMLISPIRADRAKDFEAVMARLHQALTMSADDTRRRQAAGWRLYRAAEPGPGGSVLYVSIIAPAVPKADYAVGPILLEAFPIDEVQDLHERYTSAFAGAQMILSLRPLTDFGQPWQPLVPAGK